MKDLKMSDDQLIFMISLPRSGSTMLQKMLGTHSEIHTCSEPWIMLHPLHAFKSSSIRTNYNAHLAEKGSRNFIESISETGVDLYFKSIQECFLPLYAKHLSETNKSIFLDKTPRYYAVYDELKKTFPNAKFIILYRNPLAVFSSILKTWVGENIESLINYKVDLEDGLRFLERDFSNEKNVFKIKYEDLLSNPLNNIKSLLEFLDLSFEEECLNYNPNSNERWLLGDPESVYKKSGPDYKHIAGWHATLTSPLYCQLLDEYLEYIGKEGYNRLGYEFDLDKHTLESAKLQYGHQDNPEIMLSNFLTDDPNILIYREKNRAKKLRQQLEESQSQVSTLQQDLEKSQSQVRDLKQQFRILLKNLNRLCATRFITKPFTKYKAYNDVLNSFNTVKSQSHHVFTKLETPHVLAKTNTKKIDRSLQFNELKVESIDSAINHPSTSQALFTIITVTYNAAELLKKTIESVAAQSFKNIEYIIVDGASSDGTQNLIEGFGDKVTMWISEQDSGIYDAMNKGIELANGQWINFMNAGDVFSDENVLENIANHINVDSEILFGDRHYIKHGKKQLQKAKPVTTIFERMPFGHQSTFIKTSILQDYKFNDTYKFSADYELLLRLYLDGHCFQYIDISVCDFLAGGQSESGLRPYIEVIKILLDNTKDKSLIENNAYLQAFRRIGYDLLDEMIKK